MLIHSKPCWLTIASARDVNGILLHYMKYHGIQRWPARTRELAGSKRNSISWGASFVHTIAYVGIYIVMLSCTSIFLFGFRTRRLRRHAKSESRQRMRTVLIDLIVQTIFKSNIMFAATWPYGKKKKKQNKFHRSQHTDSFDIIWTYYITQLHWNTSCCIHATIRFKEIYSLLIVTCVVIFSLANIILLWKGNT